MHDRVDAGPLVIVALHRAAVGKKTHDVGDRPQRLGNGQPHYRIDLTGDQHVVERPIRWRGANIDGLQEFGQARRTVASCALHRTLNPVQGGQKVEEAQPQETAAGDRRSPPLAGAPESRYTGTRMAGNNGKNNQIDKRIRFLEKIYQEDRKRWEKNNKLWKRNDQRLTVMMKVIQQQNERFEKHDKRLEKHDGRLEKHDGRLEEQNKRLEEQNKSLKEQGERTDATLRMLRRHLEM